MLRTSLKLFVGVLVVLAGLYLFFSSRYYIGNITKSEIEVELGFAFSNSLVILEYEQYGWAEEWGEEILFKLGESDCISIAGKFPNQISYSDKSRYHTLFKRQGVTPNSILTLSTYSSNGNFRNHALDEKSCLLYRLNHIE